MSPSVGHSSSPSLPPGWNARSAAPASSKMGANSSIRIASSPLPTSSVTTSRGLSSIQVLSDTTISEKYPTSSSAQSEWHWRISPSSMCTCVVKYLTPMASPLSGYSYWLCDGPLPTNAALWAAAKVTLL